MDLRFSFVDRINHLRVATGLLVFFTHWPINMKAERLCGFLGLVQNPSQFGFHETEHGETWSDFGRRWQPEKLNWDRLETKSRETGTAMKSVEPEPHLKTLCVETGTKRTRLSKLESQHDLMQLQVKNVSVLKRRPCRASGSATVQHRFGFLAFSCGRRHFKERCHVYENMFRNGKGLFWKNCFCGQELRLLIRNRWVQTLF